MSKPCYKRFRKNSEIFLGCIHHTVTSTPSDWQSLQNLAQKIETWHSKRPWAKSTESDARFGFAYISYHVLVGDGVGLLVQPIPTVRYASSDCCAGKKSANRHGVHFALLGNFQNSLPSERQLATLVCVWGEIEKSYGLDLKIVVHREQAKLCGKGTACPGEKFYEWYQNGGRQELVEWINHFKESGELPFGYLWRRERNGWIVWKDSGELEKKIKELEEKVKKLAMENMELRIRCNSLGDQVRILTEEKKKMEEDRDKLIEKIRNLEEIIENKEKTILLLRARIGRLEHEAFFCRRIRSLVDKILDFFRKWLGKEKLLSRKQ